MLLNTYFDAIELHRNDKFVALRFRTPHRVISTGLDNGGIAEGLDLVYNHQGCEPAGPLSRHPSRAVIERPDLYAAALLERHGLGGLRAAQLGTAANMNNLAVVHEEFRDIAVLAVATGGVESNAARAGDPASGYEFDGRYEPIAREQPPAHGTINVMIALNQPMLDGALVRAVMTATEAKTAALQELSVPSRYSSGLATGTGTDQVAVCVPAAGAARPLRGAGHHTTAGELIGKAVRRAIKETLLFQNGMHPSERGSCARLMERFGLRGTALVDAVLPLLPPDARASVQLVPSLLERDPLTVLAVAAFIHVCDQIGWGVVPSPCRREAAANHGAQIAVATAGRRDRWNHYHDVLAERCAAAGRDDPAFVVPLALGLGYADKWEHQHGMLAALDARIAGLAPGDPAA
ncbi:adenosylcobinamide amidohydrolase [Propionivibrio sp.]|uniref:adenosylcobinamide amidohydrolase n=1 Tax=Propionivibrio sp. TaxID=2212460 RepID=UPI0039E58900